ncbi:uncharacterized protein LOC101743235 isoform X1 [Bombyx mori]|uniref:PIN domain-containing protein n=1 Tax=Bombyx mori TaxID=7091 RepID=A0A8R2C8N3_BOMMO|nr:uncharacterized protein LOC101743235 isoform X2 [Bombyx mori]
MNTNNHGWTLCPSKRFPGKFYYFNVLNGEAAWSLTDNEGTAVEKNKEIHKITDNKHNYAEPSNPPENSRPMTGPKYYPKIVPEFGQAVFPKYVQPSVPNIVWTPIPLPTPLFATYNVKSTEDKLTQTEIDTHFQIQNTRIPLNERFMNYKRPGIHFNEDMNLQNKPVLNNAHSPYETFGTFSPFSPITKCLIKEPILKLNTDFPSLTPKTQSQNKSLQDFSKVNQNVFFKVNNNIKSNSENTFARQENGKANNESFKNEECLMINSQRVQDHKDLMKLEKHDLRLLLLAKKRGTSERVHPSIEKKTKTVSDEPSKLLTSMRVTFNLNNQDYNEEDKQNQNVTWNLRNLFLEDINSYFLIDIETFLEKLNLIECYIAEDENRRLLIPELMRNEIDAFSRVEARDIKIVCAARKITRMLARATQQFIILQNKWGEHLRMSTNDLILNYCIEMGHRAILITDDSNLRKRAVNLKIKCLSTQQISSERNDCDIRLYRNKSQNDVTHHSEATRSWRIGDGAYKLTCDNNTDGQRKLSFKNTKGTENFEFNTNEIGNEWNERFLNFVPADHSLSSIDNELKGFSVVNDLIEHRLRSRFDEWTCSFTQIMESTILNIIQPNDRQPINSLIEALMKLRNYCEDENINNIIEKLKDLFENNCQRGKIKKDINGNEFMKIIGCGFILLKNLQIYYANDRDLEEACESMDHLIRNIVDPAADPHAPDHSASDAQHPPAGTDAQHERRIFRKKSTEVLNYVMKHYPQWESCEGNDVTRIADEKAQKIPDSRKVFRALGKDLNHVKIDRNNNMSMTKANFLPKKTTQKAVNNTGKIIENGNIETARPMLEHQNDKIQTQNRIEKKIDLNTKEGINGKKLNNEGSKFENSNVITGAVRCDSDVRLAMNMNSSDLNRDDLNDVDDVMSVNDLYDSGIENDSYQAYSLAKSFFYELSTTFIEVHEFINETGSLIRHKDMEEPEKMEINNKIRKTLELVNNVTGNLKRIIEREDDGDRTIRRYLIKAGIEATADRRMDKYGQVTKKCLEQWRHSQSALRAMLALTDIVSDETYDFDNATSSGSVQYINIFE